MTETLGSDTKGTAEAMSTTTESEAPKYTIDELAAASHVPSRTIRFYQSKGVLMAPQIKGRVAFYGDEHVEPELRGTAADLRTPAPASEEHQGERQERRDECRTNGTDGRAECQGHHMSSSSRFEREDGDGLHGHQAAERGGQPG